MHHSKKERFLEIQYQWCNYLWYILYLNRWCYELLLEVDQGLSIFITQLDFSIETNRYETLWRINPARPHPPRASTADFKIMMGRTYWTLYSLSQILPNKFTIIFMLLELSLSLSSPKALWLYKIFSRLFLFPVSYRPQPRILLKAKTRLGELYEVFSEAYWPLSINGRYIWFHFHIASRI